MESSNKSAVHDLRRSKHTFPGSLVIVYARNRFLFKHTCALDLSYRLVGFGLALIIAFALLYYYKKCILILRNLSLLNTNTLHTHNRNLRIISDMLRICLSLLGIKGIQWVLQLNCGIHKTANKEENYA
uniref:Uncharacterized protein n=1 Tax=Glossina pallidipes TaxID=7398 RepID=A0A1A9ZU21_GLOPL